MDTFEVKQSTTKNILVKRGHYCYRVKEKPVWLQLWHSTRGRTRDSKDGVARNLSWEMHRSKVQGLSRAEKWLRYCNVDGALLYLRCTAQEAKLNVKPGPSEVMACQRKVISCSHPKAGIWESSLWEHVVCGNPIFLKFNFPLLTLILLSILLSPAQPGTVCIVVSVSLSPTPLEQRSCSLLIPFLARSESHKEKSYWFTILRLPVYS